MESFNTVFFGGVIAGTLALVSGFYVYQANRAEPENVLSCENVYEVISEVEGALNLIKTGVKYEIIN